MRAFIIDAEHRTVSEINFTDAPKRMEEIIGGKEIVTGSLALNVPVTGVDVVYIADDKRKAEEYPKRWFQIDADRDVPSSFPTPGRGLVVGVDIDGEICDSSISLEALTARTTFTRRKFRAFTGAIVGDASP